MCLKLEYPSKGTGRAVAASRIADLQRSLIKARPGSPQWKELRARITAQHSALTADVARIRRDLKRRLAKDYKRK